jgi:multiple sugar transport system permease protein
MNQTTKSRWWLYAILSVAVLAVAAPFIWMLLGSFKSTTELRQSPPTWWPQDPSLDNYRQLFSKASFGAYFMNSTIVAVVVTAGNLLFCSMVGYALAMLDFPGRNVLFGIIMGTLLIPGMVTFVPQFVLAANVGLVDTLPGLFLPFLVAPFGVFLMRQYMKGLPRDLIDAGRVDGAGELRIFWRIILPLCGPALATLGILTFLASWNNFLWPLVVLPSPDNWTLPLVLRSLQGPPGRTPYDVLMAGSVVSTLPLVVGFLVFQRRLVSGIMAGTVKG